MFFCLKTIVNLFKIQSNNVYPQFKLPLNVKTYLKLIIRAVNRDTFKVGLAKFG